VKSTSNVRVVRSRDGEQSFVLRRRADHLELLLGNVVLLSSAALETERAFGRLSGSCPSGPSTVLVGGLGFGATVHGVLEATPSDVRVLVVEKLDVVVDVARSEAKELLGGVLEDPRVTLQIGDVADVVAEASEGAFAAILLDVDNGPAWASFRTNARLYAGAGLAAAFKALMPGGMYAVWSGYPVDRFVKVLRSTGFSPRIIPLYEPGPNGTSSVRARAYVGVKEIRQASPA
jgi:spermidine synthase